MHLGTILSHRVVNSRVAKSDKCPASLRAEFHMYLYGVYQMGEAGLRGMRYAPNVRRAQGTRKRRPAMRKRSTASWMKRAVERVLRSRIALQTATHSPWVRLR